MIILGQMFLLLLISIFVFPALLSAEEIYTYFVWKSSFPYSVVSDKFEIKNPPSSVDFVNLLALGKSGQKQPSYNTREISWINLNSILEISPSVAEKNQLDRSENLGLIKLIQKKEIVNRNQRTIVNYENYEKPKEFYELTVEVSTP